MIEIKENTDKYKNCSACAFYRKPNAESIKVYTLALSISKDSNRMLVNFCEDCIKELIVKLS